MKHLFVLAALLIPATSFAEPFEGPYTGIYLGKGQAEDKGIGHDQSNGAANGWTHKPSPDSTQYGLMAGYSWRMGSKILLGLEADLEGRSGDDGDYQKINGVTDPDFLANTRIKATASLRGRIGYVFGSQTVVYATAGYAAASVKRTFQDFSGAPEKESHSSLQGGLAVGAGVDYRLTEKVAARLEYRYTDYGKKKVSANLWDEFYKQRLNEESIRVALSYQF